MNEFEDLVDMLRIEQPDENSEMVIETVCETNDEGEVVCETITGDNVLTTELELSSDQELNEIDQEFQTMFDRYFAPIYNALSLVNTLNPYDYIFEFERGADDGDVLLDLNVDASVEAGGADFYNDENVEQVYFMELNDASDFMTMENNGDGVVLVEVDEYPFEMYYEWVDGEFEYDPYDDEIIYDEDEYDFVEVSRWQEQVFGELLFVVLALVLARIVLFCRRSRSRRSSDRTTPLMTVQWSNKIQQMPTKDLTFRQKRLL